MPYRDNSTGARDTRQVLLYSYTFNLSGAKTVKSITLPTNRNVVILAMNLNAASGSAANRVSATPALGKAQITLFPAARRLKH
jgi:hypothetical protein